MSRGTLYVVALGLKRGGRRPGVVIIYEDVTYNLTIVKVFIYFLRKY